MPAWQHLWCWLSLTGMLNSTQTVAACPGEKHLATHLQTSHPPARKQQGVLKLF